MEEQAGTPTKAPAVKRGDAASDLVLGALALARADVERILETAKATGTTRAAALAAVEMFEQSFRLRFAMVATGRRPRGPGKKAANAAT